MDVVNDNVNKSLPAYMIKEYKEKIINEVTFVNYLRIKITKNADNDDLFYLRYAITEINKALCLIEEEY